MSLSSGESGGTAGASPTSRKRRNETQRTDRRGVILRAEDELGCPIVPDIRKGKQNEQLISRGMLGSPYDGLLVYFEFVLRSGIVGSPFLSPLDLFPVRDL